MKTVACPAIVAQPKPRLTQENFAAILDRKWDITCPSQPHHDILDVIEVADEIHDHEVTELAAVLDCIHLGHTSDEDSMKTGEIDGPVNSLQLPSRSLFDGILDYDWEECDCSPAPSEAPSGTTILDGSVPTGLLDRHNVQFDVGLYCQSRNIRLGALGA